MQEKPWYSREQTVKQYELYYQTKYRKADEVEKSLIKRLLEQFHGSERILEVGCGTGHFTRWMNSLGLECCGLDSSGPMLREAKRLWTDGQLIRGDSDQLPFRSKSFDLVVYVFSLEFMSNVTVVFAEAERIARKGIIIGLINKWSFTAVRRLIQSRIGSSPFYKSARFYSMFDIGNILNETLSEKFKIAYWDTTVFPNVFGSLKSKFFPFGSFLGIAVKLEDKHVRVR